MTELATIVGTASLSDPSPWDGLLLSCDLIKVLAVDDAGRRQWAAGLFALADGGVVVGLGGDRHLGSTVSCSVHPPGRQQAISFTANCRRLDDRLSPRWEAFAPPLLPPSDQPPVWYLLTAGGGGPEGSRRG